MFFLYIGAAAITAYCAGRFGWTQNGKDDVLIWAAWPAFLCAWLMAVGEDHRRGI